MKRIVSATLLALFAGAAVAQEPPIPTPTPPVPRPENWAEPVALEGVPNLHRLTPQLYRSEQPTALGMRNLEKLGIRTVINLRAFNDDLDELRGTTLRAVHVPVHTWHLETEDIVAVMRELRHPENGPFLIHCQHGADRTGLMSAMYRMLEQNWSAEDALQELVDGGYGYHSLWRNIKRYVRSADVPALRAAVGDTGSTATVTDN
jgi:protein tyrosine/serine phosphatase